MIQNPNCDECVLRDDCAFKHREACSITRLYEIRGGGIARKSFSCLSFPLVPSSLLFFINRRCFI